jgi:hypothetical protein
VAQSPAPAEAPRDTPPAQTDAGAQPKPDAAAPTDGNATDGNVPVPATKPPATATADNAAPDDGGLHISAETLQVIAATATATVLFGFAIAGGVFFYRRRRLTQRPVIAMHAEPATDMVEASPLTAMEDERHGEIESLTQLEEAFDSPRLRESRRVRDAFLRDVLDDDPDDPSEAHKQDSAIRVNSNLKMLLATDPEQYKAIFLSLIFLSKVGAALNRNDIILEELNGQFSREFLLLQSYFKIHILELDDRHRIRQELPGLFYCLQLSQLQKRQGKRRFSAA